MAKQQFDPKEQEQLNSTTDTQQVDVIEEKETVHKAEMIPPKTAVVKKADITSSQLLATNFEALTIAGQLEIFKALSLDESTGITSAAAGVIKFQRAKELGIPWANAVTHMHMIKGKVGIDINIAQAIVSRPSSGIKVEVIRDYEPVFDYIDSNGTIYQVDYLPENHVIVTKFSNNPDSTILEVAIKPTFIPVASINGVAQKPILKYLPVDFVTELKFTRLKKAINEEWYTETTIGKFSWQDAITAKLPFTSGTNIIDPNSNWSKRPKFMIYKSAYWDGAKKIANDLLLGAYDPDDLRSID